MGLASVAMWHCGNGWGLLLWQCENSVTMWGQCRDLSKCGDSNVGTCQSVEMGGANVGTCQSVEMGGANVGTCQSVEMGGANVGTCQGVEMGGANVGPMYRDLSVAMWKRVGFASVAMWKWVGLV